MKAQAKKLPVDIVVNELGELLNVTLTPGNIDDRQPVPDLLSHLFGKIFADRGYVSQKLASQLLEFGVQFFALAELRLPK